MPQHVTACPALTWERRCPARLQQQPEGNQKGRLCSKLSFGFLGLQTNEHENINI